VVRSRLSLFYKVQSPADLGDVGRLGLHLNEAIRGLGQFIQSLQESHLRDPKPFDAVEFPVQLHPLGQYPSVEFHFEQHFDLRSGCHAEAVFAIFTKALKYVLVDVPALRGVGFRARFREWSRCHCLQSTVRTNGQRYTGFVRLLLALAFCSVLVAQSPYRIPYTCTDEDMDAFGLTCSSKEPCPVYAELSTVEFLSGRLFVTGNLHTVSATLYGLLLVSDDGGKTWTEPLKRERWTSYELMQFADLEHGWVSGVVVQPLPKDPFLLLTSDAGKTWRQRPLFEESRFGSIHQLWFDTAKSGELVLDRSQGTIERYERYESQSGGESWELKETASKPMKLAKAKPPENPTWRLRADSASKTYRLEQRTSQGFATNATFEIHVADCKDAE